MLDVCVGRCIWGTSCLVVATSAVASQILRALHGDWKTARSAPLSTCWSQLGLAIDYSLGKERIYTDILILE